MGFNNPVMPWRELNKTLSWTRYGELSAKSPEPPEIGRAHV